MDCEVTEKSGDEEASNEESTCQEKNVLRWTNSRMFKNQRQTETEIIRLTAFTS